MILFIECMLIIFIIIIFIIIFNGIQYTKYKNNKCYVIFIFIDAWHCYIQDKFSGYDLQLHRENGPAKITWFGGGFGRHYYLNDVKYKNKQEWQKELDNRLIKDIIE